MFQVVAKISKIFNLNGAKKNYYAISHTEYNRFIIQSINVSIE